MKTDVRIVAATNVNMQKAISEGKFREDLYYRLNTIPIQMPPLRDRGNDILLLFRLFAMQMAEKYNLPRITLTDSAKQLLLDYKWPGNVRQLKNITEQMSVLCRERTLDVDVLRKYIPQDRESMHLATIGGNEKHSFESEREILYKILYELRGNVAELKRDLNSLRKRIDENGTTNGQMKQAHIAYVENKYPASDIHTDFADAEEITPEQDSGNVYDSLNLRDISRQMIEKALERNGGNRRLAAAELGISDRTLYRRLKQYGLESNNDND